MTELNRIWININKRVNPVRATICQQLEEGGKELSDEVVHGHHTQSLGSCVFVFSGGVCSGLLASLSDNPSES